jgi:hypothetical protein
MARYKAAQLDHLAIVELLAAEEAKLQSAKVDGQRPLQLASLGGRSEVVTLLL